MDKFDLLLQNNPIDIKPKKGLAHDTWEIVRQVRRINFLRRFIGVIFILTSLLFIAKWVNNDLMYLMKVLLYNYSFVKSQSLLYLQAFSESFPTIQVLTVVLVGILWLGWRYFETFITVGRIKDTRITMKMLRMTPRLLITSTILITIAMGVSGYTYAQQTEQKKLELLKEYINQSGRSEFETNVVCDSVDGNHTNFYEIKKNAKISSANAKFVIEALCNQDQTYKTASKITRQLNKKFDLIHPGQIPSIKLGDITQNISWNSYYKIKKIEDGQLELTYFEYGEENTKVLKLDPEAKVYQFGTESPQPLTKLNEGGIISPITLDAYLLTQVEYKQGGVSSGGILKDTKIVAIVILPSQPDIKWYDPTKTATVTQITTCHGNPQDRCSFGGMDFFPSGGGEGNSRNPLWKPLPVPGMEDKENVELLVSNNKEIAGTITEINDKYVKIKTSSGRIFTVNFGSDPVGEFNRDRSQYYKGMKVGIGDTLLVSYTEVPDQHATTINSDQISRAVLGMEFINKGDPDEKY